MLLAALGIFAFGLVQLEFSPARMLAGLHQLGWIVMLMIPPDPGSSLPAYLVALGETLSIAMLGTTLAALFALPVSLLAAKNIVPSNIFRFPVRRFLELDPRRRHADLGAGLDQCRRPRTVRRRAGDCGVGFRRLRQVVLRSHRGRRQEADRGHPGFRRQRVARNTFRPDAAGAACDRRAGALFHRVRIPARRPSSASSAQVVSACNWQSRSGCWNGRKCHS